MDCTDARRSAGASIWPGLIIALVLALLSAGLIAVLARIPLSSGWPLSMMMIALLLGLTLAPVAARRSHWLPGLEVARGSVLKLAVILIGLRLSLVELTQLGLAALPLVVLAIVLGLGLTLALARLLGIDRRLATLLAVGTAICGASAIAATAPALQARREEICYAIACVALLGLSATLVYPVLLPVLLDNPTAVGLVLGASIHDTAQVTAAASLHEQAWAVEGTLAAATVTKLLRNSAMLLVIPALLWWALRDQPSAQAKVPLPLFILGFLALSVVRTLGDLAWGAEQPAWQWLIETTAWLSTFGFAMALAALAMGIRPDDLRRLGWKPAVVAFVAALAVFMLALLWVRGMVN